MKKLRNLQNLFGFRLALVAFAVVGCLASTLADAHNGRHHHRARVGVYVGPSVVMSPFWYPPYSYHYPPTVVVRPASPVVYVEQADASAVQSLAPQAQASTQQYWHYCPDSKTYYPYVNTCASAWQRVIPHPPAPN